MRRELVNETWSTIVFEERYREINVLLIKKLIIEPYSRIIRHISLISAYLLISACLLPVFFYSSFYKHNSINALLTVRCTLLST